MRTEVYTLIKRKTEAPSEARKIVETVPQENGYEAFRMLGLRYEPQTGLKRLIELSEINLLQNKRCKTAAETALVLLEIERRKMRILEIGGDAPPSDALVTVLWAAMDPNTTAYVAGKIDLDSMEYVELRQAVMTYTNLITSTTTRTGPAAMDISAIESVTTDSKSIVPSDVASSQGQGSQQEEWNQSAHAGDWSGDTYWTEGEADWCGEHQQGEQINGIKGKGKGKGK